MEHHKTLREHVSARLARSEWLLDYHEYIIITRDLLDRFGMNEEEPVFVAKVQRLKIPLEVVSKMDKRLFLFNDINMEMKNKPHKSTWTLMKSKNFKRALLLVGGTRLTTDLRKYYLDLEDIVREFILSEGKSRKQHELIEAVIENALKKYTDIIDDKIISQLSG